MPSPLTVIEVVPVEARLLLSTVDADGTSKDTILLADPALDPLVNASLRVPATPPLIRHLIDVSDSHSLVSHELSPTAARAVYPPSPMPAPWTVMRLLPVPAALLRVLLDSSKS